jgi:hypothetical protein
MSLTYYYALLVATSGKAPEFGASRLEQLDRGGGIVLLISTYNACCLIDMNYHIGITHLVTRRMFS